MSDSIKNEVQKQFAKNAAKYVTSTRHAKGEDLALLVEFSGADQGMQVLDIATGGGHVANALAPMVQRVVAYDLTDKMLETAAAFIRGNGHHNVAFVQGDAEQLPFEEGAFDLVTCRIAAHHFPNIAAFVKESFRVLKPGGKLLLIDNVGPEEDAFDQFYNEVEKHRDPSHVKVWKKSAWLHQLETTGFRVETMVCFPKPFQFQDWCERAGLAETEQHSLEQKLLQAPAAFRQFFSIVTDASGGVSGFQGEAAYFQAVRPRLEI